MNQFFISLIVLGIVLIIVALVGIAYDRKKSRDAFESIDAKRDELTGIVNDAELMIDELNRFSDYIVTQMDIKNEEMNNVLKSVEERIGNIKGRLNESAEAVQMPVDMPVDMVVNGNGSDVLVKSKIEKIQQEIEEPEETVIKQEVNITSSRSAISSYKIQSNYKNNVIPINSKYAEVLMLAEEGLSEIEIAKKLGMGKGEVELVLGMNK